MKKIVLNLCFLLISIVIAGCSNKGDTKRDKEGTRKEYQDTVDEKKEPFKEEKFSVWTTYWDAENIDNEIGSLQEHIDNICYFAAYFNEDQQPCIP